MLLFPCKGFSDNLPNPEIKRGIARITVKVNNLPANINQKDVIIDCFSNNILTGSCDNKATLNPNNQFQFNIPLETDCAFVGLTFFIDTITASYVVGVNTAKELVLDITLEKGELQVKSKGGLEFNNEEMININKAFNRFHEIPTWRPDYYKMTPEEFAANELDSVLPKKINESLSQCDLSQRMKDYLAKLFNLEQISGRVLFYKEEAENSYRLSKDTAKYIIQEPEKSYYSFLRNYDLNNPQYLYCYSYPVFLRSLLDIKAFNIPDIRFTPIGKWIDAVKSEIKNTVGIDKGLFYDLLAANAYIVQLSYRNNPLSDKQIEYIKSYHWIKKDIIDILLERNDQLKTQLQKSRNLNICPTPLVPKEKLMESIISKYKGKVVVVDFWATWCAPCKDAMKEIETLREEFNNKDVVFVYLTCPSSPKQTWQDQIKVIGGEQYYLTGEEWSYLFDEFDFKAIPTYLIFSESGTFQKKFVSFPGVETMRETIEGLLQK